MLLLTSLIHTHGNFSPKVIIDVLCAAVGSQNVTLMSKVLLTRKVAFAYSSVTTV